MLMWTLSVNALPTKDNMSKRIESIDQICVLCSQEEETCCHLILYCLVAKTIWFASCWGFKPDCQNIQTYGGITNIVLDPPNVPLPKEDQWIVSLNMAFILDESWYCRNQKISQGVQVDIQKAIAHVQHKFIEYSTVLEPMLTPPPSQSQHLWEHPPPPPPPDHIKINVDVPLPSLTQLKQPSQEIVDVMC